MLTIRQFKEMVLADLRNAMVGGALRRIAAQEIGPGLITTGCDVGQVALARCLRGEDAYVSTELDLTADVTRQTITQDDFFKNLFSGADGLRKNASAGALSMSVGMALGNRKSLTVCTIGGELVVDGEFFESLCFASAHSLPLAIVIWNNDGTHSNGNLIKQLSGFGGSVRGSRTLLVEAVKGYDYPALCHVMEEQISRSRSGVTTLTLVESGQDDVKAMTQWVEEKQIASAEQIKELSDSCMKEVDRSRKAAYYSSLVADTPLLTPQPQLLDLSEVKLPTTTSVMQLPFMPEVVNKAVGIARRGHIAVAEVRGCSLDGNLMSSYPEAHVVLRSTSISAGYALAMTAENVSVLTPCSYLETKAAYKELLLTTCQSVVVETGDFSKIEQDSVPVSVWEDFGYTDYYTDSFGPKYTGEFDVKKGKP